MNILVIAQHIGRTAPGKVFESLIKELSEMTTVDVICSNYYPSSPLSSIRDKCIIPEPKFINPRLTAYADRIFNITFGISWRDWLIGRKQVLLNDKYDAILALGSAGCLAPLQLAYKLKKRLNTRVLTYLVDACPTPYWWKPPVGQSGVGRFLKRVSKKFDYFASSNPQMLAYQRQFISISNIKTFDILYTASLTPTFDLPKDNDEIIFVYLGSLYGLRTPKYIVEAFQMFVKEYPYAKLFFVGTNSSILNSMPENIRTNVEIKPFTDNPEVYYKKATALIDIDADYENDVFLSSKFTNYIFVNRPIICETGRKSPLRNLVDSYNSIILCDHSSQQLYNAFKQCVNVVFDYSDRDTLMTLFSPQYNVKKILDVINR